MKNMKRILALMVAVLMIASMVPAFGATATDGTITIHSPIMGAKYYGYRVFEMTMNAAGNAFSYTISDSSPFYQAVKAYAEDKGTGDTPINGLNLTVTNSDEHTFNVTVTDKFDAQKFGKYLEVALKGDSTTNPVTQPTITNVNPYTPEYGENAEAVTVATASAITFKDLPLGYYLILSEYPQVTATVTIGEGDHAKTINAATDGEDVINAKIAEYVNEVVDDEYVEAYLAENPMTGTGDNGEVTAGDKENLKIQLKTTLTEDTKTKVAAAIEEAKKANAELADLNVLTQRLVFIDSTTPDADIIEKNEEHKWDVPVNPTPSGELKPHGEPHGGKNIVIQDEAGNDICVDWTEANVGDNVHYQLSINAVNFERTSTQPITVKQIKEYIIGDYENKNMTFNADKKLMVRIVKKDAEGNIVGDPIYQADWTAWSDKFFHNDNKTDLGDNDVLGGSEGGLPIQWVDKTYDKPSDMTNVTVSYEFVRDVDGNKVPIYSPAPEGTDSAHVDEEGFLLDDDGNKIQATDGEGNPAYETKAVYWVSKYPNDVTILVDYYMTLNDTATIDGDGNINISQYGVTYTEPDDYTWTPAKPDTPDDRKPTELKEKDDAKVYTYALAIHKVDELGRDLAGAKFKIKGLTATKIEDGWYKVDKFDAAGSFDGATELVTDSKGFLVVEGLMTSQEVEIQETQAPDGYNKLTYTVTTNPKKISEEVTTSTTVIYYEDEAKTKPTGKVVIETVAQYTDTDNVFKSVKTTTYKYENGAYVLASQNETVTGKPLGEINQTQLKPVEFKVENKQGAELPSTGGIGTTLFYVGGGILILLAVVLLVTKRRMSSND